MHLLWRPIYYGDRLQGQSNRVSGTSSASKDSSGPASNWTMAFPFISYYAGNREGQVQELPTEAVDRGIRLWIRWWNDFLVTNSPYIISIIVSVTRLSPKIAQLGRSQRPPGPLSAHRSSNFSDRMTLSQISDRDRLIH
jgi:hypothetical protein